MKLMLSILIGFLLAVSFVIGGADKCSSDKYMGNFFPKVASDYSKIKWAHGVNSKELLHRALKDDSMMLEADVSFGTVDNISTIKVPIMAHPPTVESDITLRDWLKMVIKYRIKGIKLDFKSTDVLESSFLIIKEQYSEINFPVWINADILPGPVRAPAIPVNPKLFLQFCKLHLPLATISPSWTTFTNSSVALEEKRLNWQHVHDMVLLLREENITQPVTFPVRAAFVRASMELLEWLVNAVHDSSLTVWSGIADDVDVDDLLVLRKSLPFDKVYYDLPPFLNDQFQAQKDNLSDVELDNMSYFDKSLFTIEEENNSSFIVAARTMVLRGQGHVAFNYPPLNNGLYEGFEIFSAIVEFPDTSGNAESHSIIFRFRNQNGKFRICLHGEIEFWDGSNVMRIQTASRMQLVTIRALPGLTHDTKEEKVSVSMCLQPIFEDSEVREYNSPTICQEIKVSSTEQPEPLFKITSSDHAIKVLKDMRSNLPVYEVSSAGKRKFYFSYLVPVFLAIVITGLNLSWNLLGRLS